MATQTDKQCLEITGSPERSGNSHPESIDGVVSVEEVQADLTRYRVIIDVDIREAIVLNLAPLGLVENSFGPKSGANLLDAHRGCSSMRVIFAIARRETR